MANKINNTNGVSPEKTERILHATREWLLTIIRDKQGNDQLFGEIEAKLTIRGGQVYSAELSDKVTIR